MVGAWARRASSAVEVWTARDRWLEYLPVAHADEIEIVLDGDGLAPATVDPFRVLPYVLSYLEAMRAEAELLGEKLEFEGFKVAAGSFRVITKTNKPSTARRARKRVHAKWRRGDLGEGHMRRLAAANTSGYVKTFKSTVAGKVPLRLGKPPASTFVADIVSEMTSFRGELVGIDARKEGARAKFRSVIDGEMVELDVERANEGALLQSFRRQLDVVAQIRRDAITLAARGGALLSFSGVEDGPALPAWQEWFRHAGSGWSDISPADIERELGREDGEK